MNDDVALYSNHCEAQKKDAKEYLERYSMLLKWKDQATILDVGAAEGTTSFQVLLPKLPKSFHKLVLCDTLETMVDAAKNKINNNRIEVVQMDITQPIPIQFKKYFDHVFSFYCLNYLNDESCLKSLQNIFDMLKPGGGAFMSIVADSPIFDICNNLAKYEKWASYVPVFLRLSPFHRIKSAEEKLKLILESVGFNIQLCHYEKRTHVYPSVAYFLGVFASIVPFSKTIPKSDHENFKRDLLTELYRTDLLTIEIDTDGKEKAWMHYGVLIAHGIKSTRN